tara:strand:+ start:753 stop:1175 length:423 start_codon:yes stop_codon:yes gene_type:complete
MPLLPDYLMPADPGEKEPTLSNFIEMYKFNKNWYKETNRLNSRLPGFIQEELLQLRAIYEMLFIQAKKCMNSKCGHYFTEAQAAIASDRLVSPILMQCGAQFSYEKEPKYLEDKKYVCPNCSLNVEPNTHIGAWLPIIEY